MYINGKYSTMLCIPFTVINKLAHAFSVYDQIMLGENAQACQWVRTTVCQSIGCIFDPGAAALL